jgi:isopenicillin N synthase-like dioxygenase
MGALADFTALPVVDLSRWEDDGQRAALAAEVREICHHVGFFQLVGTGITEEDRAAYFAELERFFALPDEVKAGMEKARSPHLRGWERIGSELTDNRTDHREQVDLSTEYPAGQADADPPYLRLYGPNQWLPDEVLPGFREAVETFVARLEALAARVMEVLSAALGLAPGFLEEYFGEQPMSNVKLIHYPPTPPGEAGVNAHHDAGFVTLLMQHEVGGLEVVNAKGEWVPVPVRHDAFVVNIGEILQGLSGSYLVATKHRVIAHEERYSSAYFAGPDLRTRLTPLRLDPAYAQAVAASPRHSGAGFMARRDELLAGQGGTGSAGTETYGDQMWEYYRRSYPEVLAAHHADVVG